MKLSELQVDGFGVWNDLRLRDLSPQLTVFYGPNEAGKTTLMHFLRAMLYGVTAERRERYLPPRDGGRPGGSLGVVTADGRFRVSRHVERGDGDRGRVLVTLPDGEEQGDRLLREALESVDERTYCNVFAIGLDEINELGALEGAEAARWIYRLTSGLDRVSLYDVIQGLRDERKSLLAPAGERSQIATLLDRRERLRTEIEELGVGSRRWSKLAVEIDEVDAQSEQLQAELREADRRARRVEIALGLKPLWTDRQRVAEDLRQLEGLPNVGDKPLERLDALSADAEELERRRAGVRGQRRQVVREVRELPINDVLARSCCRLDGLAEQADWLAALDRQSEELAEEVERLTARVETEEKRLAKLWRHKPSPEAAPTLDDDMLEALRPAGDAVREAERLVADTRRELENTRGQQRHFDAQLEGALTSSEKLGLPHDIESAGELVSLLRRRLKAEQRVEQVRREVAALEDERLKLIEGQVLPIELYLLLCGGFATAAVVVFWPFIAATSAGFWLPLALLGAGGCWFLRHVWEENRANQLDECVRQLDAAGRGVDKALQEQRDLDKELPMAEGSVQVRLQHAEKHLEELERMLPVEAERRKASQRTKSAEELYRSAQEELKRAEQDWRDTLRAVGLPDETTAAEVEKLAGQHLALAELRAKREAREDEALRCAGEQEKLAKRIAALAEEADLALEDAEPADQLDHLLTESRLQTGRLEQRKKLRLRARELKEKEARLAAEAAELEARRREMFAAARVEDEAGFRAVVADVQKAAKLADEHARLTREIAAAIGASGTEQDYADLMSREGALKLDGVWAELTAEREALEKQLRDLAARRAVLQKDRQGMVEDTALADKQVQLDLVDGQLATARERWRERAAVGAMLELIRSDYEQHRQPETLVEASRYLERLTRGRYPRVWTPLAEDVLLVDNADGESLAVENLSRGAREQLFLSVRLALVATFARRGVQLPMILDDVLVNFDDNRARIAAGVLRDFAAEGHQLLVFTCHEHVWRMFQEVGADARRLPLRWEDEAPQDDASMEVVEEADAIVEPEPAVQDEAPPPPPPERKPKKKPRPAAPEPAFVDAEYLPLAPVTEVRTIVEKAPLQEAAAANTPPAEPLAVRAEFSYGASAGAVAGEYAYGRGWSEPARPTDPYGPIDEPLAAGFSYGAETPYAAVPAGVDEDGAPLRKKPASNKKRSGKSKPMPIKGLIPGMALHYARCCHPVPGDKIVGIVTTGRGVTIHTVDCDTLENFADTPERWLDISWSDHVETGEAYTARLKIIVMNEPGALGTVSTIIGQAEGNITNLKIVNRETDFYEMHIDVHVKNATHLKQVTAALNAAPEINSVQRAQGR